MAWRLATSERNWNTRISQTRKKGFENWDRSPGKVRKRGKGGVWWRETTRAIFGMTIEFITWRHSKIADVRAASTSTVEVLLKRGTLKSGWIEKNNPQTASRHAHRALVGFVNVANMHALLGAIKQNYPALGLWDWDCIQHNSVVLCTAVLTLDKELIYYIQGPQRTLLSGSGLMLVSVHKKEWRRRRKKLVNSHLLLFFCHYQRQEKEGVKHFPKSHLININALLDWTMVEDWDWVEEKKWKKKSSLT